MESERRADRQVPRGRGTDGAKQHRAASGSRSILPWSEVRNRRHVALAPRPLDGNAGGGVVSNTPRKLVTAIVVGIASLALNVASKAGAALLIQWCVGTMGGGPPPFVPLFACCFAVPALLGVTKK